MTRIEKTVVIQAPLEKVYTYASDWRNITRYFDYVEGVEPRSEKTLGEGALLALRVRFLGRTMNCEWRGIENEENVGWAFDATLMGVTARKRWMFSRVDDSTRVTYTLEYRPSPPIIGHAMDALLIRREWDRLCERTVRALKQLVEAAAVAGSDSGQQVSA